VFVALMWLVAIFEFVTEIDLSSWGIYPLKLSGLRGVLFSPFIHGDWQHLMSNTLPFLIMGFLLFYSYRKVAFKSLLFIYLASGFMVWLIGRPAYHIGASNIVYGFAFFLFFSGAFRKDIQSIAMSLLVVFLYGSIVWGLLPFKWEISWEGHLMGGLAGAFMAFVYRKVDLPPQEEEEDDEDDEDDAYFAESGAYWMRTEDNAQMRYRYIPKPKDVHGTDTDK
jgi:membrane associated rhomboid family serine protease